MSIPDSPEPPNAGSPSPEPEPDFRPFKVKPCDYKPLDPEDYGPSNFEIDEWEAEAREKAKKGRSNVGPFPYQTINRSNQMGQEISSLLSALAFSAYKHRKQFRKDEERTPYINHPIALALLLATTGGVSDPVVLQAALLHDTVEDTETTFEELSEHFGADVASVVRELTDDKALEKNRRKELQVEHASHASPQAALVKLADKICNLRDISNSPPADWPLERQREYFDWARRVVEGLPPVNEAMSRAFEDALAKRP